MIDRERLRRIRRARRWIKKQGWRLEQNEDATGFQTVYADDGRPIYGGWPSAFCWSLEDVEDYITRLKAS